MASTLPPEIVEEILLRVLPDEPAHLVCRGFLHRYRRFHGSPPLLGYIHNLYSSTATARFIPTSTASFVSESALGCNSWLGRVLVETNDPVGRLIVWDPVTGGQHHLSKPTYYPASYSYACTGAVLCAANGCDHLDCHSGPFLVVFVLMVPDEGGIGLVFLFNNCIYMCLQQDGTDGIGAWVKHKVMELETLLPECNHSYSYRVIGFVEGTHTIFITLYNRIFTLDLKSRQVRKVGEKMAYFPILPYISFYTPRFCRGLQTVTTMKMQ